MNKNFETLEEAKEYIKKNGFKAGYITKNFLGTYKVETIEEHLKNEERNKFLNEALGPCYGQD